MRHRLVLAAALAVGLSSHAQAQFAQGQRMMLVDEAGRPINTTNALPVTGGGSGGSGASTVSGSMEQDVRATGALNAATLNAAITTPINGQATLGYTFTGLTGSGATLTYEQSIDGGTTWTGINAINRGTGAPEATRTTDGQIALSTTGRTTIRVRVSTAGTGTITVATNVSVREGIFSMGSPLPPGTNVVGSVLVSANATANASGNPIFTSVTNFPATQPVSNGGTFAVQNTSATPAGNNVIGSTTIRTGSANRSATVGTTATTLMNANPGRQGWKIKNDSTGDIWINFDATATATPGGGNFKIPPGGYLASEPGFIETGAMSAIGSAAGLAITAREH